MDNFGDIYEVVEVDGTIFTIADVGYVYESQGYLTEQEETANNDENFDEGINPMEMLSVHLASPPKQPMWSNPGLRNYFECQICNAIFTTKDAIENHKTTKHESIVCYICKDYVYESEIKHHMMSSHNKEKKCPHCPRWFKNSLAFQNHKEKCREAVLKKEAKKKKL